MNRRLVALGISKDETAEKKVLRSQTFFKKGNIVKVCKKQVGIVEDVQCSKKQLVIGVKVEQNSPLFDWEYAKGILLQSFNDKFHIKFNIGSYLITGYVSKINGDFSFFQIFVFIDTIQEDIKVKGKINLGYKVKVEDKWVGVVTSVMSEQCEFNIKDLDIETGNWIRRLIVRHYNSGDRLRVQIGDEFFYCIVDNTRTESRKNYVLLNILVWRK